MDRCNEEFARISSRIDQIAEAVSGTNGGFLSVGNAAKYADVSEKSIRRLIAAGRLTGYRLLPGRILIDRQQLDALVQGSLVTPVPTGGHETETKLES